MCCRTASTKPILPRYEMKTAIPPNGVTARCVSRRINRSSDNRATISRGTGLSVASNSIPLLSQILRSNLTLNFVFQAEPGQIRAFLEAGDGARFAARDRGELYAWVNRASRAMIGWASRVRAKMSGLSAQMTRLMGLY